MLKIKTVATLLGSLGLLAFAVSTAFSGDDKPAEGKGGAKERFCGDERFRRLRAIFARHQSVNVFADLHGRDEQSVQAPPAA